jgi:hypothetical protein
MPLWFPKFRVNVTKEHFRVTQSCPKLTIPDHLSTPFIIYPDIAKHIERFRKGNRNDKTGR